MAQMIQIEIMVPLSQTQNVEPLLEVCCLDAGDKLLGRREFQEDREVLFMVVLMNALNGLKHISVLHNALQQQVITSFQFTHRSVLKLSSPTILELMHDFPMSYGDTWIPAINHPQSIYLSLPRLLLTGKQAVWILNHKNVTWESLE